MRKAYVTQNEVYITIKNVKGHYEFYEGSEFIRSCDINELDETKKDLEEEYEEKYGKFITFV